MVLAAAASVPIDCTGWVNWIGDFSGRVFGVYRHSADAEGAALLLLQRASRGSLPELSIRPMVASRPASSDAERY